MQRLLRRNEFLVFLIIVGLSLLITLINPAFFSLPNLFRILRESIDIGIFALGVLIVLISGGIDVSFPAIAIFALYTTVKILNGIGLEQSLIDSFVTSGQAVEQAESLAYVVVALVAFGIGGLIGIGLGLINAVFIALYRLPTLIVTLGTLNMFRGFLLFFIGSVLIRDEPVGIENMSRAALISVETERGVAHLNALVLLVFFFAVGVALLLRYTMLGRGIYAIGGDREAAERAGFNLRRIQFFIYAFVGFLAGIGGIVSGALTRQADPFSIVGMELDVIAAVVLGGASIAGGRGTVIGTLLGVLLITLVNSSLVLIGIPSAWRKFFVGVFILIGVGIPAIQARRAARKKAN